MAIDLRPTRPLAVAVTAWLVEAALVDGGDGPLPPLPPELAGIRSVDRLPEVSAARPPAMAALAANGFDDDLRDRLWDLLVWQVASASEAALRDELLTLARTDPLTGLLNRRGLGEVLDRETARARRTGEPLSLVIIDLDRFKGLNDTYGHVAGDTALRAVADLLSEGMRTSDVAGRWGGDEFALVFPGLTASKAHEVVDRLRATFTHPSHRPVPWRVSFSAGVADLAGAAADTETLMARADTALYVAKAAGGNKARTIA